MNESDNEYYTSLSCAINSEEAKTPYDVWKGCTKAYFYGEIDAAILEHVNPYCTTEMTIKANPARSSITVTNISWSGLLGNHGTISDPVPIAVDSTADAALKILLKMHQVSHMAAEESRMRGQLQLFVWTDFCSDYTPGLAFAIAHDAEEAMAQVQTSNGCEPWKWG